jgi:hypothetical protein
MMVDEMITEELKSMGDDALREFANGAALWCKEIRLALNRKANDLQRSVNSKKSDGSSLSDGAQQEIMDAQLVVFQGIEGDVDTPGLLAGFPKFEALGS